MEHLLYELGLVIISSSVVGVILYQLKQPLILAYILAGVLIGPVGFGLIENPEFVHGISSMGIMLMLFLVGLEMNTSKLKELGKTSLVVGAGQVAFTGLAGFFLSKAFDFSTIQSIYIATALTFSSTVIAIKLLSDKRDTNSHYGQICVGVLIIQDILAITALLALAGFKEGSFDFDYMYFAGVFLKGIALAGVAIFAFKKILDLIYSRIATSHELLVLFSLSWCFLISLASMKIGFSMEIGAFIAGISLANLPYTFEINAKSRVLRDFFITIFFAALGTGMVFSSIESLIVPLVVLSLFVLIGNPLIVLFLMGILGYDKKTSFFTGLNIANISEFSLIVIALGAKLGHLGSDIVSMVAIIAISTMVLSSYMITYNNNLFRFFKKSLTIFELRSKKTISKNKQALSDHIIMFGCGRMGEQVLNQVIEFKDDYIIIDNNSKRIEELTERGVKCMFGDVEDEGLLEELSVENAELIISTLPNIQNNYYLMSHLGSMNEGEKPFTIIAVDTGREGLELTKKGVDYVILKPHLGASQIHNLTKEIYQLKELEEDAKENSKTIEANAGEDEIAEFIHDLNKNNLKKIKSRIRRKEIRLKKIK